MSEFHSPDISEMPLLSRRSFLIGMGALSVSGLSASKGGNTEILPEQEVHTSLPEIGRRTFTSSASERIDTAYLPELLTLLQTEIFDTETKVKAVQSSLRRIRNTADGAEGTAFQIDNSGYYITAEHAVPKVLTGKLLTIIDPYSGEKSLVTEYKANRTADIAVIYAPNGRSRGAARGMQFDFQSLEDQQKLWMIGSYTNKRGDLFRCIKYGRVDNEVELTYSNYEEGTRVAVRGMIPFGGTSGSPIVNSCGTIVGVESGAFPDKARTLKEYRGSVITPLSYAQALPDQPGITIS